MPTEILRVTAKCKKVTAAEDNSQVKLERQNQQGTTTHVLDLQNLLNDTLRQFNPGTNYEIVINQLP